MIRARSAGRVGCVSAAGLLAFSTLAACSSSADGPDSNPTATTTAAPSLPPVVPPGPLETYLGYTDELQTPEAVAARLAWSENLTTTCMAEQGFEYVPFVPSADDIEFEDGPVPGSPEYVEHHGYGIWSQPSGGGLVWNKGEDPNDPLVAGMTEAAREAYELALSGPIVSESGDGSVTREGGCQSAAEAPSGGDATYLVGVRREAIDFLAMLDHDTRFAEVDAAWASCMRDAGFTDHSPATARQRVADEFAAAQTADGAAPDPSVVSRRAADERRVALADLHCRDSTDWATSHRAIEVELQQAYVNVHLADLEALTEAMTAPAENEEGLSR